MVKPLAIEDMIFAQCKAMNEKKGGLRGYDCPKCNNKGYYYTVNGMDFIAHECTCKPIRADLNRIKTSRLGASLEKCTFSSFQTSTPLARRMKELGEKFTQEAKNKSGKWLFAGGQPGSGKTHICTAVTGELLRSGLNARYIIWNDETVKIKAKVLDAEAYSSLVEPLKHCDVLYIDDFFRTGFDDCGERKKPSPADARLAFEIINHRYNQNESVTIISSELSLDEIIALDEGIGSRINERAKGFVMNIPNKSCYNFRLGR